MRVVLSNRWEMILQDVIPFCYSRCNANVLRVSVLFNCKLCLYGNIMSHVEFINSVFVVTWNLLVIGLRFLCWCLKINRIQHRLENHIYTHLKTDRKNLFWSEGWRFNAPEHYMLMFM